MEAGELPYALADDSVPVTRHLFVRNLSWSTDSATLAASFARYGEIATSRVIKDEFTGISKGYGFVSFCRREDARRALSHPNNLIDDRMTVCYPSIPRPSSTPPYPHHHPRPGTRPLNANAPSYVPAGYNGPPPGYRGLPPSHGGPPPVPSTGPAWAWNVGYQNARFHGYQAGNVGYQNAIFQGPGFQGSGFQGPPGWFIVQPYQAGLVRQGEMVYHPARPMGEFGPQ